MADRDLGRTIVIRADATLVTAHSDKELAAGTAWWSTSRRSTPRPGGGCPNSLDWELGARERAAIAQVPAGAWGVVLDEEDQPRDPGEAGVIELTALLRHGPHGDQLAGWPADLRIIACDLLCWLRLLCLEGPFARAEPKTLRYRILHTLPASSAANANAKSVSPRPGPGPRTRRLPAHRARFPPTDPMLIKHVPDPRDHLELWNPAPTRRENRAPDLIAP